MAPGGGAAAEVSDETILLAATLRNVGTGIAILHGWRFYGEVFGDRRYIAMLPRDDGQWLAAAGRHWNIDRPDPR